MMTRRTIVRFRSFLILAIASLGLLLHSTAWSADGAETGLNGWVVSGVIIAVLALGLYLQSIRRRVA